MIHSTCLLLIIIIIFKSYILSYLTKIKEEIMSRPSQCKEQFWQTSFNWSERSTCARTLCVRWRTQWPLNLALFFLLLSSMHVLFSQKGFTYDFEFLHAFLSNTIWVALMIQLGKFVGGGGLADTKYLCMCLYVCICMYMFECMYLYVCICKYVFV